MSLPERRYRLHYSSGRGCLTGRVVSKIANSGVCVYDTQQEAIDECRKRAEMAEHVVTLSPEHRGSLGVLVIVDRDARTVLASWVF